MFEIAISSSSNSIDKVIDEYHDSNYNGSSSSSNSSGGNTTDEEYTFDVPGIPLEIFWEHVRTRAAFGASTSMSIPSSPPLDEEETMYNCVVNIPSKTNEKRLIALRRSYQIPDDLNLRLTIRGEWCCEPRFGRDIYEAYLLGGLR